MGCTATKEEKNESLKEWRAIKKDKENKIIDDLLDAFRDKNIKEFDECLRQGVKELKLFYAENKHIKDLNPEQRNDRLQKLFAAICRQDAAKEFIDIFLAVLPILNERILLTEKDYNLMFPGETPLQLPKKERFPDRVLHAAIQAHKFENAKYLLKREGIKFDKRWGYKKYTPLMLLFTIITNDNYDDVFELIQILASKEANINKRDFQNHPLTVLCKNKQLTIEKKTELVRYCLQKFSCDIDSDDKKVRNDILKLGIVDSKIQSRPAKVTRDVLKSLILNEAEKEFSQKLKEYIDNKESNHKYLKAILKLIENNHTKTKHEYVKKIFDIVNEKKDHLRELNKKLTDSYSKLKDQLGKNVFSENYSGTVQSIIEAPKNLLAEVKNGNLHGFSILFMPYVESVIKSKSLADINYLIDSVEKRRQSKYQKIIFDCLKQTGTPDESGTTSSRKNLEKFIESNSAEAFQEQFLQFEATKDLQKCVGEFCNVLYVANKNVNNAFVKTVLDFLGRVKAGSSNFAEIVCSGVKQKYEEEIELFVSSVSNLLKDLCKQGASRMVELLLINYKSPIQNKHPFLLITLKELQKNRTASRQKCFELILNQRRIRVNSTDKQGQTALHFALQNGMDEEAWSIITERTPYLGQPNNQKQIPLQFMNRELLEAFLNTCITVTEINGKSHENDIRFDVSGILPYRCETNKVRISGMHELDDKNQNVAQLADLEMNLFYIMSKNEHLKLLLKHPVIYTLIQVKWLFMRWFLYLIFLFTALFAVGFIFYSHYDNEICRSICWVLLAFKTITLAIPFAIVRTEWRKHFRRNDKKGFSSTTIFWNTLTDLCIDAKLQTFQLSTVKYVFSSTFLLHLYRIAIPSLAIWSLVERSNAVLSVLILLSGIDVVLHLSLLPWTTLSTRIVMLETVSKSFLSTIIIYAFPLISFGLGFFVQFANKSNANGGNSTNGSVETGQAATEAPNPFNTFDTVSNALLKSLVMMIGEFDAADIAFENGLTLLIIFIFYVFLTTLVITNLINVLAVTDIQQIREETEEAALTKRVETLWHYEKTFSIFKRWTSFHQYYNPVVIIRAHQHNKIVLQKLIKPPQKSSSNNKTVPYTHNTAESSELNTINRSTDNKTRIPVDKQTTNINQSTNMAVGTSESTTEASCPLLTNSDPETRTENKPTQKTKQPVEDSLTVCFFDAHSVDCKVRNTAWNIFYSVSEPRAEQYRPKYLKQDTEKIVTIEKKTQKKQSDVDVGNLVLIRENNEASSAWKMACILKVKKADDGSVTGVIVRTIVGATSEQAIENILFVSAPKDSAVNLETLVKACRRWLPVDHPNHPAAEIVRDQPN